MLLMGRRSFLATGFLNFLRLWLVGVVCLILVTLQMMVRLSAVHSKMNMQLFEDRNHRQDSPEMSESVKNNYVKNLLKSTSFSSLWSIETSYLYTSPEYGHFRQWGCRLPTTPLIYVHIGKTGGGSVRARLAASSLNYTKSDYQHIDFSYYPLKRRKSMNPNQSQYDDEDRAQFCENGFNMFNLQPTPVFSRSLQCKARTPLGQAIACPELFQNIYDPDHVSHLRRNNIFVATNNRNADLQTGSDRTRRHPCFYPPSADHAHLVFVGHHNFGAEIHWLPAPILLGWWNRHWKSSSTAFNTSSSFGIPDDRIGHWIQSLKTPFNISVFQGHSAGEDDNRDNGLRWCKGQPRPIFAYGETTTFHQACSEELYQSVDALAKEAVQRRMANISRHSSAYSDTADVLAMAERWSTVYASMPVLRVTLLRDPFSWLCSKFFWHHVDSQFNVSCDDIEVATYGNWSTILRPGGPRGWARRMALQYLFQLCGDDCAVRSYYDGSTNNLHEIELQAVANLRQGFAVVGVFTDLEGFYDMLNRRVQYLNTSLNVHVVGDRHESESHIPKENGRCKELYQHNLTFQKLMLAASSELAALQRVYQVGVEVNLFQRKELDYC